MGLHSRISSFFLLFFLSGCVSISGLLQPVAVVAADSPPLKIGVYGSEVPPKEAPLFMEVPRGPGFYLTASDARRPTQTLAIQCQMRWGLLITGNAPLLAFWPWASAAAFGVGVLVDFLSGAAYECPHLIAVPKQGIATSLDPAAPQASSSQSVSKTAQGICRVTLVALEPDLTHMARAELREWWKQAVVSGKVAFKKEQCDRLVDFAQSEDVLERHLLSHEKLSEMQTTYRAKFNELGHKFGATDLMFVSFEEKNKQQHVQVVSYNLFTGAKTLQLFFPFGKNNSITGENQEAYSILKKHVSFWPNAAGFSLSSKRLSFETSPGISVSFDKSRNTLPVYLTSWSIQNLEHPHGVRPWEARVDASPQLAMSFLDHAYNITQASALPTSPLVESSYSLRLFSLHLFMHIKLTEHTPVGAFSLGVGGGPSFLSWKDSFQNDDSKWQLAHALNVAYTRFLSDSVFMTASYETLSVDGRPPVGGAGFSVSAIESVTLTIGMYFSELQESINREGLALLQSMAPGLSNPAKRAKQQHMQSR